LLTLPFLPLLLASVLPAQKAEAVFEWQKRAAKIGYESLPIGTHSLEKLKVGAPWRMGATHDASTMQPAMPILVGDSCIAPGAYRITFLRQDETTCAISVDGSAAALGGSGAVLVPGVLGKTPKAANKLKIELAKKGAAVAGNQPAQILVQFGADEWRGEVTAVGNKLVALPGGKLAVFSMPTACIEKGAAAIATWSTSKDADGSWNVVLEGDKVRLVPWMQAPKVIEDTVVEPDSARVIQGTVKALDQKPEKELAVLELREATLVKGEMRLVVAFGTRVLECKLPEPKKGK
jgi:hypothetical protein